MTRPRIFFDTNIPEWLVTPPLDASIDKIRKYLSKNYVYVLSRLTIDELWLGIEHGDERYFAKDQAKMNVLRGMGDIKLLLPPATFAWKEVFGVQVSRPVPSLSDVKKCIDVLLRAKSKPELEHGLVPLRFTKKTGGLNFQPTVERHAIGKAEHVRKLEALRAKNLRRPTRDEWVRSSFRNFGAEHPGADWSKLGAALEAAFSLNEFFCTQAEGGKYDFADHDSDWIDIHQLFYLSDPTMHFLTRDKRMRNRVQTSGQASRIIMFEDFPNAVGV